MVSTVNAPWRDQIDADALASALPNGDADLPQVDSFFIDSDLGAQRIFAVELGVPRDALLRPA